MRPRIRKTMNPTKAEGKKKQTPVERGRTIRIISGPHKGKIARIFRQTGNHNYIVTMHSTLQSQLTGMTISRKPQPVQQTKIAEQDFVLYTPAKPQTEKLSEAKKRKQRKISQLQAELELPYKKRKTKKRFFLGQTIWLRTGKVGKVIGIGKNTLKIRLLVEPWKSTKGITVQKSELKTKKSNELIIQRIQRLRKELKN